jgi:hypothetical protein
VIISFTGSQKGMTHRQRELAAEWLESKRPAYVVHGGCTGADDEFDQLAASRGIHRVIYPGLPPYHDSRIPDETLLERGPCTIHPAARHPLDRNPIIAREGHILLAAPRQAQMILRSGTWATVRSAMKQHKTVEILEP